MPRRHKGTKVHEVSSCLCSYFFAAGTPGACPKGSSESGPGAGRGRILFLTSLSKDIS
ncbi:Uncharacterized protein dnm_064040 [Desulfonema magnum]|uniref:Uncharacterized protein n=1 Tax=Desulfonema magnum TaxID=45655 RepID=A0A975GRU9_9BACT|nr:Uncharacterized protein dnm_064040 [Desulfonema magnum]